MKSRKLNFIFRCPLDLQGAKMTGEIQMIAQVDERIEAKDAWLFIANRLFKESKNPIKAAEAMWTDSMCESERIKRPWTADQKMSVTPERMKRIVKSGVNRLATLSPAQDFILKNWRQISCFDGSFRGLRDWSTFAAIELLECQGLLPSKSSREWSNQAYDKMVSRMGLSVTRKPPVIISFEYDPQRKKCRIIDNL